MTGSIARAKVGPPLIVDLDPLRALDLPTSHFQGCAYAVDPRTTGDPAAYPIGYLFQLQAVPTGPGDVEDLRVHRFVIVPSSGSDPRDLRGTVQYLDSMLIKQGGHVQSCHVRISAAGNPYLWAGLEVYDTRNRQQGKAVHRIRYQPGKTVTKRSKGVERILTGLESADVVGCDPWAIVLRRGGDTSDRFSWHREKDVYGERAVNRWPNEKRVVAVEHGNDDDYQSALAQGAWQNPKRVVRIAGWPTIDLRLKGTDGNTSRVNAREAVLDALDKVPHPKLRPYFSNTLRRTLDPNAEPEGGVTIGGTFHLVVQFNAPAHRFLGLFPMTW